MAVEKQISYGLKFQARALVAMPGGEYSRWLVGTNALRDENEVSSRRRCKPCQPAQGVLKSSKLQATVGICLVRSGGNAGL